ncbi:hypothetical protein ColTof4_05404 [Colletotrichum tofieldiae]|nr:hypothetical protein ColTof3_10344 [Colletotrichum tofieldiae]GKT72981.1 hypothetical protein ColTof4_05404 [Colletotrichum tofieldiae]
MRKPRYVPRGVGEGANAAQAWMGNGTGAKPASRRHWTLPDAPGWGLGEALWGDEDKAEEGEDDEDDEDDEDAEAAASTTA